MDTNTEVQPAAGAGPADRKENDAPNKPTPVVRMMPHLETKRVESGDIFDMLAKGQAQSDSVGFAGDSVMMKKLGYMFGRGSLTDRPRTTTSSAHKRQSKNVTFFESQYGESLRRPATTGRPGSKPGQNAGKGKRPGGDGEGAEFSSLMSITPTSRFSDKVRALRMEMNTPLVLPGREAGHSAGGASTARPSVKDEPSKPDGHQGKQVFRGRISRAGQSAEGGAGQAVDRTGVITLSRMLNGLSSHGGPVPRPPLRQYTPRPSRPGTSLTLGLGISSGPHIFSRGRLEPGSRPLSQMSVETNSSGRYSDGITGWLNRASNISIGLNKKNKRRVRPGTTGQKSALSQRPGRKRIDPSLSTVESKGESRPHTQGDSRANFPSRKSNVKTDFAWDELFAAETDPEANESNGRTTSMRDSRSRASVRTQGTRPPTRPSTSGAADDGITTPAGMNVYDMYGGPRDIQSRGGVSTADQAEFDGKKLWEIGLERWADEGDKGVDSKFGLLGNTGAALSLMELARHQNLDSLMRTAFSMWEAGFTQKAMRFFDIAVEGAAHDDIQAMSLFVEFLETTGDVTRADEYRQKMDVVRNIFNAREAAATVDRGVTIPREDDALKKYTATMIANGNVKEAHVMLMSALKGGTTDARVINNYATMLSSCGSNARAAEYLKAAMAMHPQNPDLVFNYGKIMRESGDTLEFGRHMRMVLEENPGHAAAAAEYADYLVMRGDYRHAVLYYQRAAQGEAGLAVTAQLHWSEALMKLNRFEEAAPILADVINATPNPSARLLANYAVIAQVLGHADMALEYSKKALEIDPADPETMNNHAAILASLNDLEGAVEFSSAAVANDHTKPDALSNYADLMAYMGNDEVADEYRAKALHAVSI